MCRTTVDFFTASYESIANTLKALLSDAIWSLGEKLLRGVFNQASRLVWKHLSLVTHDGWVWLTKYSVRYVKTLAFCQPVYITVEKVVNGRNYTSTSFQYSVNRSTLIFSKHHLISISPKNRWKLRASSSKIHEGTVSRLTALAWQWLAISRSRTWRVWLSTFPAIIISPTHPG